MDSACAKHVQATAAIHILLTRERTGHELPPLRRSVVQVQQLRHGRHVHHMVLRGRHGDTEVFQLLAPVPGAAGNHIAAGAPKVAVPAAMS